MRRRRAFCHSRAAPVDTGAISALRLLPLFSRHSSGALAVSWDAQAFPALASLQLMGRVGGGLDCPAADAVWGESPRVLRLETSEAEGDSPGSGQPDLGWEGGPDLRTGRPAGPWKPRKWLWKCAAI